MTPPAYHFIHLVRGVAALWVLVVHVMIWGGWYFAPVPDAKLAVELFMLVSGFLMAAVAGPLDAPDRARFWTRRFFRIAPAYYVALLLAWLLSDWYLAGYAALRDLSPFHWLTGSVYDPANITWDARNLAWHVTFLFGLHPDYSFSTMLPDWSLSLEMQFYLAFPFLCLLLRQRGVAALALLTVLAYLAGNAVAFGFREPSLLTMKLHVFAAGMVLHHALHGTPARRVVVTLAAVCLAGISGMATAGMALGMCALAIMEASEDPLGRLTHSRLVRFASDASYGVYLFHGFWIAGCGLALAGTELPGSARVAVMLPTVILGAYATGWLVHRYVELPGIALGRRFSQSRPVSADATGSVRLPPDTAA